MTTSISAWHAASRLRSLSSVFQEWIRATEDYVAWHGDDASWWYNERANLSMLAGAAWRKKWIALEEYAIDKSTGARDPETGALTSKYGRCDLYLTNQSTSFAIEAKQGWQPIGPRVANPAAQLQRAQRLAWKDAGHLRCDAGDRRLALSFVVPTFPQSALGRLESKCALSKGSTAIIVDWLREYIKPTAVDAWAYSFPARARLLKGTDGRRVYPGVVILIRERERAIRVDKHC